MKYESKLLKSSILMISLSGSAYLYKWNTVLASEEDQTQNVVGHDGQIVAEAPDSGVISDGSTVHIEKPTYLRGPAKPDEAGALVSSLELTDVDGKLTDAGKRFFEANKSAYTPNTTTVGETLSKVTKKGEDTTIYFSTTALDTIDENSKFSKYESGKATTVQLATNTPTHTDAYCKGSKIPFQLFRESKSGERDIDYQYTPTSISKNFWGENVEFVFKDSSDAPCFKANKMRINNFVLAKHDGAAWEQRDTQARKFGTDVLGDFEADNSASITRIFDKNALEEGTNVSYEAGKVTIGSVPLTLNQYTVTGSELDSIKDGAGNAAFAAN
ncbi:MAG: hypothetical protein IJ481_00980, partial [Alphaproteobacteria bacterium]|nr:hypothetical protein [Alphaproteobacteria bacterium]